MLLSKELVAREVRRAMLDNPTSGTFTERERARVAVADEAAAHLIALFTRYTPPAIETIQRQKDALLDALDKVRDAMYVDENTGNYCLKSDFDPAVVIDRAMIGAIMPVPVVT